MDRFKWILFSVKWNWTRSNESTYSETRYDKCFLNTYLDIEGFSLPKWTRNNWDFEFAKKKRIIEQYSTGTEHWHIETAGGILRFYDLVFTSILIQYSISFDDLCCNGKQHKLSQQWLVSFDDKRRCSESNYKTKRFYDSFSIVIVRLSFQYESISWIAHISMKTANVT